MDRKKKKKIDGAAYAMLKSNDAINSTNWQWLIHRGKGPTFLVISVLGLLIRAAVSLHPYSGAGNPPKYGDFEAQRHWMEITLNLPPQDWYTNSTSNDLSYWGLDYPPLTAYQSYFHGLILRFFDRDSVALFTSRGYETYLGFVTRKLIPSTYCWSLSSWVCHVPVFSYYDSLLVVLLLAILLNF